MPQLLGKFILFKPAEFAHWLNVTAFTRMIMCVQNHHTFLPSYDDFSGDNHFALLQEMETSHLKRGFDEIGQNLTTFPDGAIALCRSFETDPAGIKGGNAGAICIENLGCFDVGRDLMREEHKATIVSVNALLCRRFVLQPNSQTLVYHHWFDLATGERRNGSGETKSCPGTDFFGGNDVATAERVFIPLVQQALSVA